MESVFVLTYTNDLNDRTEVAGIFRDFGDACAAAVNIRSEYSSPDWTQDVAFDAKKLDSGTRSEHWFNGKDQWVVVEEFQLDSAVSEHVGEQKFGT